MVKYDTGYFRDDTDINDINVLHLIIILKSDAWVSHYLRHETVAHDVLSWFNIFLYSYFGDHAVVQLFHPTRF